MRWCALERAGAREKINMIAFGDGLEALRLVFELVEELMQSLDVLIEAAKDLNLAIGTTMLVQDLREHVMAPLHFRFLHLRATSMILAPPLSNAPKGTMVLELC